VTHTLQSNDGSAAISCWHGVVLTCCI